MTAKRARTRKRRIQPSLNLKNAEPVLYSTVKSGDLKRLEAENHKLKEVVLNQALILSELKKEMNLD